jgi:hypothetical protein
MGTGVLNLEKGPSGIQKVGYPVHTFRDIHISDISVPFHTDTDLDGLAYYKTHEDLLHYGSITMQSLH